jgi:hypothetical protein
MSTPTSGPDPNYPPPPAPEGQSSWGAPQQGYGQPQPGYQPAPSYSAAPAGYGAQAGQRPGLVTGAAVTGIVWGGLGTLFGLLALFALSIIFSYGAFGALLGIFVILGLAVSVALLVGGIQALQGKSPKLLLYLSYASVVIQLLALIFSLASGYGFSFGSLLGFIVPGVIIALLWQPAAKQYYAARGFTY